MARLGMVENAPGMSALDMNSAEDMVVRNTREVVPGMIICGMEVIPTAAKKKIRKGNSMLLRREGPECL